LPMIVSAKVSNLLPAQNIVDSHYDPPLFCPPSRLDFAKSLCILAQFHLCASIERHIMLERDLFQHGSDVGKSEFAAQAQEICWSFVPNRSYCYLIAFPSR
jgi:hypothetical protein